MIVDTSALAAIILGEPTARGVLQLLQRAPVRRMSAATYVELGVVVDGRDRSSSRMVDVFLADLAIRVEPFDSEQARIARQAYSDFGRGSGHPARLNLGDCFSYALARVLREPLLFVGDDFRQTDIEIVTEPIRERRLSEQLAMCGG